MKNEWNLDSEAFDKLLAWLSPTPEEAARKYEEIRKKLIRYFRGCREADELADQTMDRIAKKLARGTLDYQGDPIRYFYGVAGVIYKEHLRKNRNRPMEVLDPDAPVLPPEPDHKELEYHCLEQCMAKLSQKTRDLIHRYHQSSGMEKIVSRQALAGELGIEMNALRIQAFKIRSKLRSCVLECTQKTVN